MTALTQSSSEEEDLAFSACTIVVHLLFLLQRCHLESYFPHHLEVVVCFLINILTFLLHNFIAIKSSTVLIILFLC